MKILADGLLIEQNEDPAQRGDKRIKIINAAIRTFARKGFYNTKVSEVAKAAGVADGTIYLYFKSKEDLLISVFQSFMTMFLDDIKSGLEPLESASEKLFCLIDRHLTLLGQNKDIAVFFQIELRHDLNSMRRFSTEYLIVYLRLISQIIIDGQKEGIFSASLSVNETTQMLFGALDQMTTNWILSNRKYLLHSQAQKVFDFFMAGLIK